VEQTERAGSRVCVRKMLLPDQGPSAAPRRTPDALLLAGRVGADLSGTLPPRRVGPSSSSCHVTSPAPFTGGAGYLLVSFYREPPRSSVGRPEHTQRGRGAGIVVVDQLGVGGDRAPMRAANRDAQVPVFSSSKYLVYGTHDVFGPPCRFVGC